MSSSSHQKRSRGQFFTVGNPFLLKPFQQWFGAIPGIGSATLLEPFAGANHLVRLMRQAGYNNPWACFDIDPPAALAEGFSVTKRNTLSRFPAGYPVAITNPPYLARYSASRRGLAYPASAYDDLYKHALAKALAATPYVAAIVPDSFINAGVFRDRLQAVVSLAQPMFDDTEHPVCLALFSPHSQPVSADFALFDANVYLGTHQALSSMLSPVEEGGVAWRFNASNGSIGLYGVDDSQSASIRFVPGAQIPASSIKPSSRLITRIAGLPRTLRQADVLVVANQLLAQYRAQTHDALMTSFKGLRADGRYRRRLDFAAARHLLDHAVAQLRS
jgi:hypothetical protein